MVDRMAQQMICLDVGCYITTPMAASAVLCLNAWPSLPALSPSGGNRPRYVPSYRGCPRLLATNPSPVPLLHSLPLEPIFPTFVVFLAFATVGSVAGLLAGLLGIGGGAVIVPALILLFGQLGFSDAWIPHQAVATSLTTVIASGAASAWSHHRRGAVRWELFLRLVPWLLIGGWLGAFVAGWLPALWLKRLFALFLLYNGLRMLFLSPAKSARPLPSTRIVGASATAFGALSALLGIGGGILIVPFLTRHGITMQRAVATSSACGVPLALAGSIGFMVAGWGRSGLPAHSIGFVYWPAALAIMAMSMPMAALGAQLAHRLPTRMLKRIFGVLLLAVGLRLLVA